MLPNWLFTLLIAVILGIISYRMIQRSQPEDTPIALLILSLGMIKLFESIIHLSPGKKSLNKLSSFLLSLLIFGLPLLFLTGIRSDNGLSVRKDMEDFNLNQAVGIVGLVLGLWISYNHLIQGKSSFLSSPRPSGGLAWNIPNYHLEAVMTILWYTFKYLSMNTFLQMIGIWGIPLITSHGMQWNGSQWTTYFSGASLVWYICN